MQTPSEETAKSSSAHLYMVALVVLGVGYLAFSALRAPDVIVFNGSRQPARLEILQDGERIVETELAPEQHWRDSLAGSLTVRLGEHEHSVDAARGRAAIVVNPFERPLCILHAEYAARQDESDSYAGEGRDHLARPVERVEPIDDVFVEPPSSIYSRWQREWRRVLAPCGS